MKHLKLFFVLIFLLLFFHDANAQNRKSSAAVNAHTKIIEKAFGSPQSISEVKDVLEKNEAYNALKKLIEDRHVTIVYGDNSFLGNANLSRGDFVVSFNSALDCIKDATKNAGLDTSLVNTYDRNKAYITSVTQVRDIQPGSVYYNAVQSLLERWGINAAFTKAATLNARSLFYEDELYDILRETLGFQYGNGKPGKVAIKRYRFAIILNDAITFKLHQVEALANEQKARDDAEKARVRVITQQIEKTHRDSVAKEIELRKMEAQKKEAEARKKLEDKNN